LIATKVSVSLAGGIGLLEIAGDGLAVHGAGPILPAHRELGDIGAAHRDQRLQHLQLLVAHRIRIEGDGRLHGDEADELEHVVLHHVPMAPALS
jgi:hypothetical protein